MLELLSPDMGDFTKRQIGKHVYNQAGGHVVDVVDVRNGDLYVEVVPGADSETLDYMNWLGVEPHHLPDQYISHVGEETIRLNV